MDSVTSSATHPSACLTTSNVSKIAKHASMTSIVQITTQMAAVTRAVIVRSVAGMVWTVLVTKLRSWQKGP